jgi:hypothetical protein
MLGGDGAGMMGLSGASSRSSGVQLALKTVEKAIVIG